MLFLFQNQAPEAVDIKTHILIESLFYAIFIAIVGFIGIRYPCGVIVGFMGYSLSLWG